MLAHVVDRYAEGAAALWVARDEAATSPSHTLRALAEIDERIEAHFEGLRGAGAGGWEACRRQLEDGEEGAAFAAAVLAFEAGAPERTDDVVAAATTPLRERAVASALGWLPYPRVAPILEDLREISATTRRIAIAAWAIHRRDPGEWLALAISDDDAGVRRRALRAAGELGRADLLPQLLDAMESELGPGRFDAAWSAALLGAPQATATLREGVERGAPHVDRALAVVLERLSVVEARAFLDDLARDPVRRRDAICGAGILGDPAQIPGLIAWASVPEMARVAGRSFTMITGVDLVSARLWRAPPRRGADDGEAKGRSAAPRADRMLPLPDPEALRAYWAAREGAFLRGQRYLRGKPAIEPFLTEALAEGRQPERAVAAIEMALRSPGAPLFEVRAPGVRQLEALNKKK